jgi:hypothetical protein
MESSHSVRRQKCLVFHGTCFYNRFRLSDLLHLFLLLTMVMKIDGGPSLVLLISRSSYANLMWGVRFLLIEIRTKIGILFLLSFAFSTIGLALASPMEEKNN